VRYVLLRDHAYIDGEWGGAGTTRGAFRVRDP
jgi:hypothetical protein